MSQAKARIAIETKLAAWAKARNPVLPAFFGIQKADVTKPVYIHGYLLPASARTECLQGDEITYLGLYQVTISCDPSQSISVAESIISEIQSVFPVDSDLGDHLFNGSITDAVEQGPTIVDNSRYNVPGYRISLPPRRTTRITDISCSSLSASIMPIAAEPSSSDTVKLMVAALKPFGRLVGLSS